MLTKIYLVLSFYPFAITNITYFWHFHAWKGVNHCVPITCKTALLYSQFKSLSKSKKKFLSKWNFKFLHDLEIQKFNSGSLKMNDNLFAWHLFWHNIACKWSWFQASNWPIDQFTFKNFKSNFFNFDITKVAWRKILLNLSKLLSQKMQFCPNFLFTRGVETFVMIQPNCFKKSQNCYNSNYKFPSW